MKERYIYRNAKQYLSKTQIVNIDAKIEHGQNEILQVKFLRAKNPIAQGNVVYGV